MSEKTDPLIEAIGELAQGITRAQIHSSPARVIRVANEELRGRIATLEAQLAEAQAENGRLREAVVLCAIPLEALHATELDGKALSDEVKIGIRDAVTAAREAVNHKAIQGETNG